MAVTGSLQQQQQPPPQPAGMWWPGAEQTHPLNREASTRRRQWAWVILYRKCQINWGTYSNGDSNGCC